MLDAGLLVLMPVRSGPRKTTVADAGHPSSMTAAERRSFRERLRRWHRRHGRELPWRGADAYRVWISEIMLQQTTVAAVTPYYQRFLAAFPTVGALAAADEEAVLRLWEGLGYYSRARNLHRAAQVIVAEHKGRLPRDVAALQQLPGVGRYTAGAIASFAYGEPAAIVEANTLRLYSRLLGYAGDPRSAEGQTRLWAFAEGVLPRTGVGEFNQALMDLGATVCTPEEPGCEACPVMLHCAAFRTGRQREIPRRAKRMKLTDVIECAVVVVQGERYLVRRCRPGERWAGLWDFPRFAVGAEAVRDGEATVTPALRSAAAAGVEQLTAVQPVITGWLTELRHGVTRYRIRLVCLRGEILRSRKVTQLPEDVRWVTSRELAELPLSTTGRKLAQRIADGNAS